MKLGDPSTSEWNKECLNQSPEHVPGTGCKHFAWICSFNLVLLSRRNYCTTTPSSILGYAFHTMRISVQGLQQGLLWVMAGPSAGAENSRAHPSRGVVGVPRVPVGLGPA